MTFEAFPNAPALRFAWCILTETPKPTLFYIRLTEAQKEEIAQRALKGEQTATLAGERGVARAYVYRLANQKAGKGTMKASTSQAIGRSPVSASSFS